MDHLKGIYPPNQEYNPQNNNMPNNIQFQNQNMNSNIQRGFQMNNPQQNQVQNNMMDNQGNNYNFNIFPIQIGKGLNNNEINIIINSSCEALGNRDDPLSKGVIKRIKNIIGGDWVVFCNVEGIKGYDLSVSTDDGSKLCSFLLDNFKFQVIKIRD